VANGAGVDSHGRTCAELAGRERYEADIAVAVPPGQQRLAAIPAGHSEQLCPAPPDAWPGQQSAAAFIVDVTLAA
jgi:hypothetical protein